MSTQTIMFLTMGSVCIGFFFFMGGYAAKSYDKPLRLVAGLVAAAFFFVLVVPLVIAVFVATGFITPIRT